MTAICRVAWKPQNDEPHVASARTRCLNPLGELKRRGLPVELYQEKRNDRYSVVVFSKAYNEKNLQRAVALKEQGKVIIFDLCDNHFLLDTERVSRLKKMLQTADYWVASNEELAHVMAKQMNGAKKPLSIIADAVEPSLICPRLDVLGKTKAYWQLIGLGSFLREHATGTHLVWFGNHKGSYRDSGLSHIRKLKPLLEKTHQDHKITITIISNSEQAFQDIFVDWNIPLHYLDWSPHTFYRVLRHHAIAIIPIEVNDFTKVKTNNRVILPLHLGLGVVADSIKSYQEFAKCTFLDRWEEGLITYINNPNVMDNHIKYARKIISKKYTLSVIADHWSQLFQQVAQAHRLDFLV
jgi:hypothetical protein